MPRGFTEVGMQRGVFAKVGTRRGYTKVYTPRVVAKLGTSETYGLTLCRREGIFLLTHMNL
jgi:hypothetical protein